MTDRDSFISKVAVWFFPHAQANRHIRLADGFRDRHDWPQAATHYHLALQIAPHRVPIWVQLGHALKEAGQREAALQAYRQGAILPPGDADAALHLGLLAKELGLVDTATVALACALKLAPGQADAQRELSSLLGNDVDLNAYVESVAKLALPSQDLLPDINPTSHRGHVALGPQPSLRHHLRCEIVKHFTLQPGREAALMVSHAPTGRLKPHILPYIRQLRQSGLQVQLVIVVDRPLELLESEIESIDGIIVRDNGGYDFGAWADGFRLCPSLFGAALLVMTNDSVIATADTTRFRTMMDRVRSCQADVVGLTASHEYGWHVQSYFLGLKGRALSSWAFHNFIRDIKRLDDKDEAIRAYEVPFGGKMRAAGLTVKTLFSGSLSHNPTLFNWRELIEQGFPFLKLLILRKTFEKVAPFPEILDDLNENWPAVAHAAGFDVELIRSAIRAADHAVIPAGEDETLLVDAKALEGIIGGHPLRVAYFGPWNYDNGLGSASRELLCTLRRTDIHLNTYPVEKPFHIHRLICPPVETLDFAGQPDVAIVHLNPDSWHLLTDAQLEIIRSAKRRIGYWVWETDRLPPAWNHNLHSVDRIWAPSEYCADIFRAATGIDVDVVPHPILVSTRISSDRATLLKRFGIDADRKVILYIFDGASYLVRKNPEALVRAFAASGLGQIGWDLVLKTKHLHDRPEAGKALYDLAERTAAVHILEVSLHPDEITSLLAAADIYASPHCSEGFGLTVAEAMAVGKPVIATDYSGTRDFVKSAWSYPVPAKRWTLEEDHGHYLAGHSWAKIDEDALAATLITAAQALERNDQSMGTAAREAVGRLLSYDAVAQKIRTSFATLVAEPSCYELAAPRIRNAISSPRPEDMKINLSSGTKFTQIKPHPGIVFVPLAADLSWDGESIEGGPDEDWLFLAPHDAVVATDAVDLLIGAATQRPDVVLFYADDVATDADPLNKVRLKPDFDKTLLVSADYIGAPVFVRRKTLDAVGGLNPARGSAALYDLILRIAQSGGTVGRIPKVLIGYAGQRPVADIAMRRQALADLPEFRGIDLVEAPFPGLLKQRRAFSPERAPAISIVIPTRQTRRRGSEQTYIESLLNQIAQAEWPMHRLTVWVGDDVSGEPDWARRTWPFTLKRIETPRAPEEPFNYASKMNQLWRLTQDEHIVFLNDDTLPENAFWLVALLTFSCDESVGGVGARLYYEDGSIQHAGMFPALRNVVHAWLGWPSDAPTYQNWSVTQREWSMVTGAVFATRRSVLDRLNGFDEKFSLEFNDVDLCLRMRNLGYRIVYNPDAEFIHAEKASRGEALPPGQEVALFLSRWSEWLEVDPSSHPGLANNRLDPVPVLHGEAWYR